MLEKEGLIGKYLNRYYCTDIEPVGIIIGVINKSTVLVKSVKAVKNHTKMKFRTGGFSTICDNNAEQDWVFEEVEEFNKIRLSQNLLKTLKIESSPKKFYDYNF